MARFDGRRLSRLRVGVLLMGVGALTFTALSGWRWFEDARAADGTTTAFAAYVDVAVTPQFAFEKPVSVATRNVVLSFVVASPSAPCTPSWGQGYPLDSASNELDLDRRVARLRQNKGEVSVSFGGAANSELATVCSDEDALLAAYRNVVTRYDVRTIDLDLEGAALSDSSASARRARVLKKLQQERAKEHKSLKVWLTLPVAPTGLSAEARSTVATTLKGGMHVSGVNLMTMNYGASRSKSQTMAAASIAALDAAHRELGAIYADAGDPIGPATLWRRMGATPMIGQNDLAGDVFNLDDARALNTFARDKGIARLSMWSLNRDRSCGPNYPDVAVLSNSCSGVDQGARTFAMVLQNGLDDSNRLSAEPAAGDATPRAPIALPSDDPATSPYPIWQHGQTYVEGTRIVRHHNVYMAKWWTQGDVPDDPTVDEFSTPWQLVGPVLPGEKPMVGTKLPAGTYPTWAAGIVYTHGQRVIFDGTAFAAKWWTQGDIPAARSSQSDPSPWIQLTEAQLREAVASVDDQTH